MLRHRTNVGRHHIQRIGPVGLQFLPSDIAGLQLWLDATDLATLFQDAAKTTAAGNGDVVGAWADKSGQGNDATQTTTSQKPTRQDGVIGGLPVVRGDITDDLLTISVTGLTNETIFIVAQKAVDNAIGVLIGNGSVFRLRFRASAARIDYRYNDVNVLGTASDITIPNIYTAKYDGTNNTIVINGGVPASAASVSATHSWIELFSRAGGSDFLNGDIAEVLIYNSALSIADTDLIENYLSNKWSIAIP